MQITAQPMLPAAVQSETSPKTSTSSGGEAGRWGPAVGNRYYGWRLGVKRVADVVVASLLTLTLAPLMLAVAAAIRTTSRGPALFRQHRVGRNGELFTVLKFRTMDASAEKRLEEDPSLFALYRESGFKIALDQDPRVTRLGRFLRRSSIDELPQLINVLRGEMSLVGPRPVVPDELAKYGDLVSAYLMALPGLTGAWQVAGRDDIKFPERAQLDADYIDNWSLLQDLKIAFLTIPATLSARGVE